MSKSEGGLIRAKNGHFLTGNPGGPGRPRRPTEASYLLTISEVCPPEVWRGIIARAVQDASDGDHRARDFLARFLVRDPASEAPKAPSLLTAHLDALAADDPVLVAFAERQYPDPDLTFEISDDSGRVAKVRALVAKLSSQ